MRTSQKKLIALELILAIILLLGSFILNILSNYTNMTIFLIITILLFKLIFGFERDRHRYTKDILLNLTIIILIAFIIYYISGIFIGFVRTENYYTFNGIVKFIIPYIAIIILKEILRYQMLTKADKSIIIIIMTCILFIILDISYTISIRSFTDAYDTFIVIAVYLLPIISSNIVATYISKKSGCVPNIYWLLVTGLYATLLPIVPNTGLYIKSLIRLLFPCILAYNTYSFLKKRENKIPISYEKKGRYIALPFLALTVFILAYFVSGLFRYHAIAVATGSMTPNILKGDVVVIDKEYDIDKLKKGVVIAYKYDDIIVVHRLVDIEKVEDTYYLYSKGDANNEKDNYIIYEDMMMGVVKAKIPYVGLPTVWLKELW